MSCDENFRLIKYEDGLIIIPMRPAVPVGGWSAAFRVTRRFGDGLTPLVLKSTASGHDGVSGVTVMDSGLGKFGVTFTPADRSGLEPGNYAFQFERMDSGFRTVLTQGYMLLGETNANG